MVLLTNSTKKKSKRGVNAIQIAYDEGRGIKSKDFTEQLCEFIEFILHRYTPTEEIDEDAISFAYTRVMERLGAINAEIPKLTYNAGENRKVLKQWEQQKAECLFDATKSNLGNYIFAIVKNAYSNFKYHSSKKFKELDPPAIEISEKSVEYSFDGNYMSTVIQVSADAQIHELPESLRRLVLWQQGI